MHSINQLLDAIQNPRRIFREINRLYYTQFRTQFNEKGVRILDADWDNLLILDACRFDVFESIYTEYDLPGKLECCQSQGTATMEFLRANFDSRKAHDVVYVSGTSMLYREAILNDRIDLNFHEIVDVWKDYVDVNDEEIPPSEMTEAAMKAAEEYPNKRLIVHFIQPHTPFIGEFGRDTFNNIEGSIWRKQRRGEINIEDEKLWRAYEENLRSVLPYVKKLLKKLGGKTVITSDHGQLFGERQFPIPMREYGHPNGIYCKQLTEVPWFVSDTGSRKRIVPEPPNAGYKDRRDDELDEQAKTVLQNLGYVE